MHHRPWDDYKITQNSLNLNVQDKTKISMLISVWTNPIASFIFVEGSMAKQTTHRYLVPEFHWENIWRKISLKNLGFWNAYHYSLPGLVLYLPVSAVMWRCVSPRMGSGLVDIAHYIENRSYPCNHQKLWQNLVTKGWRPLSMSTSF